MATKVLINFNSGRALSRTRGSSLRTLLPNGQAAGVALKRWANVCRLNGCSFHSLTRLHVTEGLNSWVRLKSTGGRGPRLAPEGIRSRGPSLSERNTRVVLYATAGVVLTLTMSYAAVPLYRIYCQSSGLGGRAFIDEANEKVAQMKPNRKRLITVKFSADTESRMSWDFKPTQSEVKVAPGETVLAFYSAKNPLKVAINGVATYSVMPFEAGQYLNKIQCFCFEEQRLNPNEEVDMPVFFYIDPTFAEDPRLENVDDIVLSYTFFEAKEGFKLPFLGQATPS